MNIESAAIYHELSAQADPDPIIEKPTFRTIKSHEKKPKDNKKAKKASPSAVYRLLSYTFREYWLFGMGLVLLALSQLATIYLPLITGQIIDVLLKYRDMGELRGFCLMFLTTFVISGVALFFRNICFTLIAERVTIRLKNETFSRFISFDIEFFERKNTGELLSRLGSDIATMKSATSSDISVLLKSIVVAVGSFVIMFTINIYLTLIILAVVPFFILITSLFSQYTKKYNRSYQDILATGSNLAEECFSNIRTVKAFSTEIPEMTQFQKINQTAYSVAVKKVLTQAAYRSSTHLIINSGVLGVLWYGGYCVIEGTMSSGQLVSFLIYANDYTDYASSISSCISSIVSAAGVAEGLFKIMDYKPKIKGFVGDENEQGRNGKDKAKEEESPIGKKQYKEDQDLLKKETIHQRFFEREGENERDSEYSEGGKKNKEDILHGFLDDKNEEHKHSKFFDIEKGTIGDVHQEISDEKLENRDQNVQDSSLLFEGNIEFKGVDFAYPSCHEVKVLEGFNLEIKTGEVIAICGGSGGGKSTIIALLERFYDVNTGQLLISGKNIKEYDLRDLHRKIGYVSQEPVLFSGTIEENITYGVDSYRKSDLLRVCKWANALDFITDSDSFPLGFNTLVGERGAKLSGGQKQRIAIARALMMEPKILVFDEATSALDAEAEHQVQMAIEALMSKGDLTMIIIAHRLSTIINCKRIVVMSKGKIEEEGNHESLWKLGGIYKGLVEKQMQLGNFAEKPKK